MAVVDGPMCNEPSLAAGLCPERVAVVVGAGARAASVCDSLAAASYQPRLRCRMPASAEGELLVLCCAQGGELADGVTHLRMIGWTRPILVVGHESPCPACDLALDQGADAWLPASLVGIQLPRIARALGRRADGIWEQNSAGVRFDPTTNTIQWRDEQRPLRPKEFVLMTYLAARPGRWVSEQCILEEALGVRSGHDTPLVRVHVRSLRKALGPLGMCIESRRGLGYRFVGQQANELPRPGPKKI